jgi:hypothetical protein
MTRGVAMPTELLHLGHQHPPVDSLGDRADLPAEGQRLVFGAAEAEAVEGLGALAGLIEAGHAADGEKADHKSRWLQQLETLAAETNAQRSARLRRAAARRARHPGIGALLALPAEFFDPAFGCTASLEAADARLDELNERLDALRRKVDTSVDGFGVRAVRALLEASRTPEGGTDGAMFMRGFRPLIAEWARPDGANSDKRDKEDYAEAASKTDSGLRRP